MLLGAGLTLFSLGIWPTITEPGFGWRGLRDWQTLMTGFLAIGAAGLAYIGVLYQVRAANLRHAQQIKAEREKEDRQAARDAITTATVFAAEYRMIHAFWDAMVSHLERERVKQTPIRIRDLPDDLLKGPVLALFQSHIGKIGRLPNNIIEEIALDMTTRRTAIGSVNFSYPKETELPSKVIDNILESARDQAKSAQDIAARLDDFIADRAATLLKDLPPAATPDGTLPAG